MKNTKHTEDLSNQNPEISSPSKRKVLASIGVSSGVLGASALSGQWAKPVVNSVILPAHAQATGTGDMTTADADPGSGSGSSRILVVGHPSDGTIRHDQVITYDVSLTEAPTGNVRVSVMTSHAWNVRVYATTTSLTFTESDYAEVQKVNVIGEDPLSTPVTIEFAANDGGGYDNESTTVTFTAVLP